MSVRRPPIAWQAGLFSGRGFSSRRGLAACASWRHQTHPADTGGRPRPRDSGRKEAGGGRRPPRAPVFRRTRADRRPAGARRKDGRGWEPRANAPKAGTAGVPAGRWAGAGQRARRNSCGSGLRPVAVRRTPPHRAGVIAAHSALTGGRAATGRERILGPTGHPRTCGRGQQPAASCPTRARALPGRGPSAVGGLARCPVSAGNSPAGRGTSVGPSTDIPDVRVGRVGRRAGRSGRVCIAQPAAWQGQLP